MKFVNYLKHKYNAYSILETEYLKKITFVFFIAFSISLRFIHFGEAIDDPHGWRQCDTANYIWDYYLNGVDFFKPAVCWMGGYKTLILEFPLTEALIAWLYQMFGPSTFIARLFFLSFYCLGVYYFYKICSFFLEKETAMLSVIIYTFLPLSYYYSRALHIDYFALSCAFAMHYYYTIGIQKQNKSNVLIGSIFATIAFLIKAPYSFSFCFPIAYLIWKEKKILFCLKWSILFVFPVVIFIWWIIKSKQINAMAPNWDFIPGYRKFDDNSKWYFGYFEHRFILRSWQTLFDRLMNDLCAGFMGAGVFIIGLCISILSKKYIQLWLWFFGVILYLLVFFNLNVIHNYYQIPFVPLISICMAIGIGFLSDFFAFKNSKILIKLFLLLVLCASGVSYSENKFFKREIIYENIANAIKDNTNDKDLLIVSCGGLSVHCPIILHRAKRNGWSIPSADLNESIVVKLCREGCRYIAFIDNTLPDNKFIDYLKLHKMKDIPLINGKHLYLIDMKN